MCHTIRADKKDPLRMVTINLALLFLISAKKWWRPKTAMVFQANKSVYKNKLLTKEHMVLFTLEMMFYTTGPSPKLVEQCLTTTAINKYFKLYLSLLAFHPSSLRIQNILIHCRTN